MNRMIAALGGGDLLQHGLQPLLELAAIFGAGNQRAEIERQQLLVLQAFRHVAIDDAQRETLDDGGLADAGLADQHGIVLGPARQHLDGAADFLVAADHRIELAVARRLGQVAGIFLQRVIGVLGRRAVGGAALAQRLDRGIEILRRDAALVQDGPGLAGLLQRERQQQPLDRDETVAGLVGSLFRSVKGAREFRRKINLAGAGARNLRQPVERVFGGFEDGAGIAAGAVDQTAGQPLAVVQQHFQHMQCRELLVALAHRQRLRRLDETARPLGVFFNIHVIPSACHPAPKALQRHLHWVSAGRIDVPQPAAVVAIFSGLGEMWAWLAGFGRGVLTNSCAVALTPGIP